jgi:putative NADH-flavin reductase
MTLYPKRLRIVWSDVRDTSRVEKAVAGQNALMSILGHTKTSRRDAQAEGIKNTVNAMKKHGVRHLVSLAGAGVRDVKDEPKHFDRVIWSLLKLLQKDVLEDAEGHARVIAGSGLEWVIVRAPC